MSDSMRPVSSGDNPVPISLLTAIQVGKRLSFSLRTVRRYDSAGMLPAPVRIGGAVRWPSDEIDAWIKAGCPRRVEWEQIKQTRGTKGGRN